MFWVRGYLVIMSHFSGVHTIICVAAICSLVSWLSPVNSDTVMLYLANRLPKFPETEAWNICKWIHIYGTCTSDYLPVISCSREYLSSPAHVTRYLSSPAQGTTCHLLTVGLHVASCTRNYVPSPARGTCCNLLHLGTTSGIHKNYLSSPALGDYQWHTWGLPVISCTRDFIGAT